MIIVSSRSQTKTLSSSFSGGELVDNEVGDDDNWWADICNCCCNCWGGWFNIWLFRLFFEFLPLPSLRKNKNYFNRTFSILK